MGSMSPIGVARGAANLKAAGKSEEPAAEKTEGEEEGDDGEGAFFAGSELEKHGKSKG